jgi:hypothetical protein
LTDERNSRTRLLSGPVGDDDARHLAIGVPTDGGGAIAEPVEIT